MTFGLRKKRCKNWKTKWNRPHRAQRSQRSMSAWRRQSRKSPPALPIVFRPRQKVNSPVIWCSTRAVSLAGWRWSSFCKTQYASDPDYGGVQNFLRCHLCVVKLLDFAKATGLMSVEVQDEGGYWEARSLEKLAREVGQWNEFVAAISGMVGDLAQAVGVTYESAIAGFPNFEHLEARGRQRLEEIRSQLRAQIGGQP